MFTKLKILILNTIGTALIVTLTGIAIYAVEHKYEVQILSFQFKIPKKVSIVSPTPAVKKLSVLSPTPSFTPTPTLAFKPNSIATPTKMPTIVITPTATPSPVSTQSDDYQAPTFGVTAPPQNVPIYDNHTCFEVYDAHDNVTSPDNIEVQYRFQGYEESWSKNRKKCLENLNNGHYDMTVRVRDQAGNIGTISVYFEVRYTPPTPTCPFVNTPTPIVTEAQPTLEPAVSPTFSPQ